MYVYIHFVLKVVRRRAKGVPHHAPQLMMRTALETTGARPACCPTTPASVRWAMVSSPTISTAVWSSYDHTWFSGPDKQEIFILVQLCHIAVGVFPSTVNPVQNGHPGDLSQVSRLDRWLLGTGLLTDLSLAYGQMQMGMRPFGQV
jgi:hypothetical protein